MNEELIDGINSEVSGFHDSEGKEIDTKVFPAAPIDTISEPCIVLNGIGCLSQSN